MIWIYRDLDNSIWQPFEFEHPHSSPIPHIAAAADQSVATHTSASDTTVNHDLIVTSASDRWLARSKFETARTAEAGE